MQIEQIGIATLIPFAKNSRTHSDAQVAQIAASIREFGFTNPVLIDEANGIIAGHGRVLAARKLKLTEVPCIRLAHLNEAQKRAYVIADNKLALNAGWDEAMLKLELADLKALDFDLDLTGFSADEIDALLAEAGTEGLTDPDETPEPPAEPVTKIGDVWVCGPHRVMCGDSTSETAVTALMANAQADLLFTDPPYGMEYEGGRGKKQFGMIKNDDAQGDSLVQLVRDALTTAKNASKGGAAGYVCFPWRTYAQFEQALLGAGWEITTCIVWDKKSVGLGHQEYRPQHEFVFYSKGGAWFGDRSQSDVWQIGRDKTSGYVHPTQKPVALIEKALQNSSKKGDTIIDCFGGSGTTLIAAEKNGRVARIMELDPKYVDVIVKRWEDFTGKKAVLESTGEQFKAAA